MCSSQLAVPGPAWPVPPPTPHHPSFKYSPCSSQMPEHRLVPEKSMPYPTSFCSSCPLSLLSPHKPSSWGHRAHHTLCRALTHVESQPFPSPGKGLSRGGREGATTQLPHNLACLCIPPKPLSSLSLLPAYAIFQGSKFVRSVSHCVGEDVVSLCYRMPRLAATRPCSRRSCHQAQPSSSYSVI